jgi:hypothetical protein
MNSTSVTDVLEALMVRVIVAIDIVIDRDIKAKAGKSTHRKSYAPVFAICFPRNHRYITSEGGEYLAPSVWEKGDQNRHLRSVPGQGVRAGVPPFDRTVWVPGEKMAPG